ncbi:hypothetical protein QTN25_001690 [Entamoeba marina]
MVVGLYFFLFVILGNCTICETTGTLYSDPLFPSYHYYVLFCDDHDEDAIITCNSTSLNPITIPIVKSTDTSALLYTSYIVNTSYVTPTNCSEIVTNLNIKSFNECTILINDVTTSINILVNSSELISTTTVNDFEYSFQTKYKELLNSLDTLQIIAFINTFPTTNLLIAQALISFKSQTTFKNLSYTEEHYYCQQPHYKIVNGITTLNSLYLISNGCDSDYRTDSVLCSTYVNSVNSHSTKLWRCYYDISLFNSTTEQFIADSLLNSFQTTFFDSTCYTSNIFTGDTESLLSKFYNCTTSYAISSLDCILYQTTCNSLILNRSSTYEYSSNDDVSLDALSTATTILVQRPFGIVSEMSLYIPKDTNINNLSITQLPLYQYSSCPEQYCIWFPLVNNNRTHNTYLAADPFKITFQTTAHSNPLSICIHMPFVDNETWNGNSTYERGGFFLYEDQPCNLLRIDQADFSNNFPHHLPRDVTCFNITKNGTYYVGSIVDIRIPIRTTMDAIIVIGVLLGLLAIIIVVLLITIISRCTTKKIHKTINPQEKLVDAHLEYHYVDEKDDNNDDSDNVFTSPKDDIIINSTFNDNK